MVVVHIKLVSGNRMHCRFLGEIFAQICIGLNLNFHCNRGLSKYGVLVVTSALWHWTASCIYSVNLFRPVVYNRWAAAQWQVMTLFPVGPRAWP